MTPHEFQRRHTALWDELAVALDAIELLRKKPKQARDRAEAIARLPELYRATCHHLALATDRQYPHFVVARLHALVERAHQALYQSKSRWWANAWRFLSLEFPALVRANKGVMGLSALLFCVPLVALLIACWHSPEMVYSVFNQGQVADFEEMYRPTARHVGRPRGADTDFAMFGHYIRNNVGISFQVFAGGLLAGVGSMFFLVANGLFIGAVAGYLTALGYGGTFWPFVCGHGAFELTAIVISGGAGLKLGWALLAPGPLTRLESLKLHAKDAVRIVYGVALMLLIAAFIEAFWSSSSWIGAETKYAAAGLMWAAVAWYFVFQGRARKAP